MRKFILYCSLSLVVFTLSFLLIRFLKQTSPAADDENESVGQNLSNHLNVQESHSQPNLSPLAHLKDKNDIVQAGKYSKSPNKDEQKSFHQKKGKDLQAAKSKIKRRKNTKDEIPSDEEGNLIIQNAALDGDKIIIMGDILAGHLEGKGKSKRHYPAIKLPRPELWKKGKIPYAISSRLPQENRALEAMAEMNRLTHIKWVLRKNEKDYVEFVPGEINCYSQLGQQGGRQEISLSPQCTKVEILHEMIHTLGFFHEQNRQDRDEYIEILWQNIDSHFQLQFKKIPDSMNYARKTPFDFNSLMLYSPKAFAKDPPLRSMILANGEDFEHTPHGMSEWDIERINMTYAGETQEGHGSGED